MNSVFCPQKDGVIKIARERALPERFRCWSSYIDDSQRNIRMPVWTTMGAFTWHWRGRKIAEALRLYNSDLAVMFFAICLKRWPLPSREVALVIVPRSLPGKVYKAHNPRIYYRVFYPCSCAKAFTWSSPQALASTSFASYNNNSGLPCKGMFTRNCTGQSTVSNKGPCFDARPGPSPHGFSKGGFPPKPKSSVVEANEQAQAKAKAEPAPGLGERLYGVLRPHAGIHTHTHTYRNIHAVLHLPFDDLPFQNM